MLVGLSLALYASLHPQKPEAPSPTVWSAPASPTSSFLRSLIHASPSTSKLKTSSLTDSTLRMLAEVKSKGDAFLTKKLIAEDGAIFSTYREDYPRSKLYGVNHETTAESVGLALIYATLSGNKSLFELEFRFVQERLIGPYGVCYWKLNRDLSPFKHGGYACSASIDDLRIAEALILGYEKWGEAKYLALAERLTEGIYENEVDKEASILVDYLCWKGRKKLRAKTLTLSYARFSSIERFAARDVKWIPILNETRSTVLKGKAGGPLFFEAYRIYGRRYSNVKSYVNSINQLLVGINLLDSGRRREASELYDFFKAEYELKGFINDAYDPLTLKASEGKAGIGAYSLLARLAIKVGDAEFALRVTTEQILPNQSTDPSSLYCGGFLSLWPSNRLDANSYDNLQALIAIEELSGTLRARAETWLLKGSYAFSSSPP